MGTVIRATATEVEIARVAWNNIRTASGFATDVPHAVKSLMRSKSPEEAQQGYWALENSIVVQGQLFEAAVAVVPVLVAGLLEDLSPHARAGMLELLFQIVSGEAHEEEVIRGVSGLGEACRNRAREGIWILYREFLSGQGAAAREILEVVELDRQRLDFFLKSLAM